MHNGKSEGQKVMEPLEKYEEFTPSAEKEKCLLDVAS